MCLDVWVTPVLSCPPPKSIDSSLDPTKNCVGHPSFLYVLPDMICERNPKINPNVSGCLRYPLFPNMCSIPLPLRPLDRAYTSCTLLTKYWHPHKMLFPRNPHCRKNGITWTQNTHILKARVPIAVTKGIITKVSAISVHWWRLWGEGHNTIWYPSNWNESPWSPVYADYFTFFVIT